jgi:hypothetical protein
LTSKIAILLPQPPECWDYRHTPPYSFRKILPIICYIYYIRHSIEIRVRKAKINCALTFNKGNDVYQIVAMVETNIGSVWVISICPEASYGSSPSLKPMGNLIHLP